MEPLADDVIQIWVVRSGSPGTEPELLSPAERARVAHLDSDAGRDFGTTRTALRKLLAEQLGVAPAALAIADDGKPRLAAGGLEFSVSHGDGLALIAVAHARVGVDVQRVEHAVGDELTELTEFVLSPRERRALLRLADSERLFAYYRAWTRKEAYVKATGEGISGRPLTEIELADDQPRLRAVVGIDGAELARWSVVDVTVAAGYVAAAAIEHPAPRLVVREWPRE